MKNPQIKRRSILWPCTALLLVLAVIAIVLIVLHSRRSSKASTSKNDDNQALAQSWDDEVPKLEQYDPKKLEVFISPLVKIANNAYGYFPPYTIPVSISGWKESSKVQALTPNVGARALVFEQEAAPRKVVVAFRGTSSEGDQCVDRMMFGDAIGIPLPSLDYCLATYSNSSLDYVSQSVNFTRGALAVYRNSSVLLTGHSLGAALAILVSASLNRDDGVALPVVAFSSPGTAGVLESRNVTVSSQLKRKMVMIGDEWDVVVKGLWKQQVGTVCLIEHPQSSACAACSNCTACNFEAHNLFGIQTKLQNGDKVACSVH